MMKPTFCFKNSNFNMLKNNKLYWSKINQIKLFHTCNGILSNLEFTNQNNHIKPFQFYTYDGYIINFDKILHCYILGSEFLDNPYFASYHIFTGTKLSYISDFLKKNYKPLNTINGNLILDKELVKLPIPNSIVDNKIIYFTSGKYNDGIKINDAIIISSGIANDIEIKYIIDNIYDVFRQH